MLGSIIAKFNIRLSVQLCVGRENKKRKKAEFIFFQGIKSPRKYTYYTIFVIQNIKSKIIKYYAGSFPLGNIPLILQVIGISISIC